MYSFFCEKKQSGTITSLSMNINNEISFNTTPNEDQSMMKNIKRTIQSILNDSYGLQYEQICRASGNQPCICYYPDHPDVEEFHCIDEITTNASKILL